MDRRCRACELHRPILALGMCDPCYHRAHSYGEDAVAYRYQGWDGRCDICTLSVEGEPAYEHDHGTHEFRGLVHGVGQPFNCNTFEGYYASAKAIGMDVTCPSLDRYLAGDTKFRAWLARREDAPLRLWVVA